MHLKHAVRPITELKTRTADVVRDAADRGPVVITQNGRARVVLMSVETFDRQRDAVVLLKLLAMGQADADAGRVVSQREAFARVAAALRRVRRDG